MRRMRVAELRDANLENENTSNSRQDILSKLRIAKTQKQTFQIKNKDQ